MTSRAQELWSQLGEACNWQHLLTAKTSLLVLLSALLSKLALDWLAEGGCRASWGAELGPSPGCLLLSLMHAVPPGCEQAAWSHQHLCSQTMLCLPCSFINGLKAMKAEVKDARVVFYGAGSSAVGVAQMIATLLQTEGASLRRRPGR